MKDYIKNNFTPLAIGISAGMLLIEIFHIASDTIIKILLVLK